MKKGLLNAFLQSVLDAKGKRIENLPMPFEGVYDYPMSFWGVGFIAGEYKMRIIGSPDGLKWHSVAGPFNLGGETKTATTVQGSANITSSGFIASDVGRFVTGTGIPPYSYIAAINVGTQVLTLSQNIDVPALATASGTVTITISGPTAADMSIMERNGVFLVTMTGGDNVHSYHRATIYYSTDLLTWTPLPVEQRPDTSSIAAIEGQGATWAGEWFTDLDGTVRMYVSLSANTGGGLAGFSIYEVHVTAWDGNLPLAWSEPVLVLNPADSIIDAWVWHDGIRYNMLVSNKNAGSVIEWYRSSTSNGVFAPYRVGDWAGWGGGVEAPVYVEITDTHHRIYFDRFTNLGIYYSDSFDAGNTWSAKALVDPSGLTGSKTVWFSHPTILKCDSLRLTKRLEAVYAATQNSRYLQPYARYDADLLTLDGALPAATYSRAKRMTIALGLWVFGQDLYGLADFYSFVIHCLGKDAAVFNVQKNGYVRLGPMLASPDTTQSSDHPFYLDLGFTYSSIRGRHPKHILHKGGTPQGDYGLGVSSPGGGVTPLMELQVPPGAGIGFFSDAYLIALFTASKTTLPPLPLYSSNALAIAGGLAVNDIYRHADGSVYQVI
jgi:hypothetical protein